MVYKWYILPIGGLYATYHPLKEPEKSIEHLLAKPTHVPPGLHRDWGSMPLRRGNPTSYGWKLVKLGEKLLRNSSTQDVVRMYVERLFLVDI